jgi:hypothetical protein
MRYDANMSTIEDKLYLGKLIVYELHVILTTYEMRSGQEKPSKGETTFKSSKEKNNQEHTYNEDQLDILHV